MSRRGLRGFLFLVVLGFLPCVCGPTMHAGALLFLAGVGDPVRPRGDELLAFVVLLIVVRLAAMGSHGAAASDLVGFRGELAVGIEVVSAVATATSVSARGDDGMSAGSGADRPAGPVDLLVLLVGLFLVIHVGPGTDDRLDQVHADGGAGSGPGAEFAPGLLRDQPADVREDDDQKEDGVPSPWIRPTSLSTSIRYTPGWCALGRGLPRDRLDGRSSSSSLGRRGHSSHRSNPMPIPARSGRTFV